MTAAFYHERLGNQRHGIFCADAEPQIIVFANRKPLIEATELIE